jgi:16S rRNA (guanine527-N7)-methyltransferase
MRERAATPIIHGKTERPLGGAFLLSHRYVADARAARLALERLLETDAPHLRDHLPSGFADAAEAYVALLLATNERMNLTRVVEPGDVARLHLLDALAALPIVAELAPRRALDLGSGGGVPGLVLALARPDLAWTLVDSVGRKAEALRGFADVLGTRNVAVVADRAEAIGRGPLRESFDLVTARACAALPVLAEYALPLAGIGGALLAWKGRVSEEELDAGARAARMLGGDSPALRRSGVPALGDHRFVVVPKLTPTPARYPRRPGQPSRHPLPGGRSRPVRISG